MQAYDILHNPEPVTFMDNLSFGANIHPVASPGGDGGEQQGKGAGEVHMGTVSSVLSGGGPKSQLCQELSVHT